MPRFDIEYTEVQSTRRRVTVEAASAEEARLQVENLEADLGDSWEVERQGWSLDDVQSVGAPAGPIARRETPAPAGAPQPVEDDPRIFHVSMSYSTAGSSPEDAVMTFFAAVQHPGSMVAEVWEDGMGESVVAEFDGDELKALERRAMGAPDPGTEGPDGP